MTDISLAGPLGHAAGPDDYAARQAARRREYRAWFALVLALALPLEIAAWPLRALRARLVGGAWPARGPLGAARSHAALVTPIILSA